MSPRVFPARRLSSSNYIQFILNMDSSRLFDSIVYYSKRFWDDEGDPFMSQFFGMDYPWFFITLAINAILFCKFWGPSFMKNRKPIDMRSICIISNGLAFGTYMLGVLLGIVCSNLLRDCFTCSSYDPHATDMAHVGIKYLGYMMLWTKIYDFSIPILAVFSKKNYKITNLQMAHLFFALLLVWSGAKVNPGGVSILIAIVDTFYQLLVYGYLIMTAASSELKPDKSFRRFLFVFRELSIMLTFLHQLYFLFQPNCFSFEVRLFQVSYCALTMIFYPIDCYIRIRNRPLPSSSSSSSPSSFTADSNNNKNNNKISVGGHIKGCERERQMMER